MLSLLLIHPESTWRPFVILSPWQPRMPRKCLTMFLNEGTLPLLPQKEKSMMFVVNVILSTFSLSLLMFPNLKNKNSPWLTGKHCYLDDGQCGHLFSSVLMCWKFHSAHGFAGPRHRLAKVMDWDLLVNSQCVGSRWVIVWKSEKLHSFLMHVSEYILSLFLLFLSCKLEEINLDSYSDFLWIRPLINLLLGFWRHFFSLSLTH